MTLLAEIALVAAAAVAVVVCLGKLRDAASARGRTRAVPPQLPRPEQLVRLERMVSMSQTSALEVHAYLRPLLAEIASRRLAARGLVLGRLTGATGREVLGEQLWELVRPGRPFPEDRHGPGVSRQDLSAMLEVLERL